MCDFTWDLVTTVCDRIRSRYWGYRMSGNAASHTFQTSDRDGATTRQSLSRLHMKRGYSPCQNGYNLHFPCQCLLPKSSQCSSCTLRVCDRLLLLLWVLLDKSWLDVTEQLAVCPNWSNGSQVGAALEFVVHLWSSFSHSFHSQSSSWDCFGVSSSVLSSLS